MVTEQVINRIYGKKRGWCFTPKDFLDLGSQEAVWQTLSRLVEKGLIRKVLRGVYEYPVKSRIQEGYASPSPDNVAQAIA
jgi:predicted transcriptional regulator of viral defense system